MATYTSVRTTARVGAYLDDIMFPASRSELLECAEDNEAPDVILDAIEALPERRYWCLSEILVYLGSAA